MTAQPLQNNELPTTSDQKRRSRWGAFWYLVRKAVLTLLTIFLGVFAVMWIFDAPTPRLDGPGPSQLEYAMYERINLEVNRARYANRGSTTVVDFGALWDEIAHAQGLYLPKVSRLLFWTYKAMTFQWGDHSGIGAQGVTFQEMTSLNNMVLYHLNYTLLLIGPAYLLLFLVGLPISLYLAEHEGTWLDRLMNFMAPISSIPAWVIGVMLITLFAVILRWMPPSGMVDFIPPDTLQERNLMLLKHAILPVLSIFLSLIFQLIYSWRTIFVTFSSEDYVDLGKAIGLPARKFRRTYLLKPNLSYVITSFSLLLIGFWQMVMALEVIFDWRGVGYLYIKGGLPNFWGESMYPGNLLIALILVVLFAYILGAVTFLLDVVYAIVDPRLRLNNKAPRLRTASRKRLKQAAAKRGSASSASSPAPVAPAAAATASPAPVESKPASDTQPILLKTQQDTQPLLVSAPSAPVKVLPKAPGRWQSFTSSLRRNLKLLARYPSAIVGLGIILLLVIGSLAAVIGLPYQKIGEEWTGRSFTGQPNVPKLALPTWVNFFRTQKLFSSQSLTSSKDAVVVGNWMRGDSSQLTYTFTFDYGSPDFLSDMFIYLEPKYDQKAPFVVMRVTTPDGREIELKGSSVYRPGEYELKDRLPMRAFFEASPEWRTWYRDKAPNVTPLHHFLFAQPGLSEAKVVRGEYQIDFFVTTFEPDSRLNVRMELLGQVYGFAGTDYFRRDLTVPLLWGMPFALVIGLGGSVLTILLSMLFAAAGVWFGGWVDDLIQRLTEVNLVLPVLAVSVLAYAYLNVSIWVVLLVNVLLNVFGAPLKSFRAALLQVRESPYIEAAQTYNAGNWRIILKYMVRKIVPVLVPQLVILIPSYVFLEATLGIFNINVGLPTWGNVIYEALSSSVVYGSTFWVVQPIALLLLTGVGFGLLGSALEKILNPRLQID